MDFCILNDQYNWEVVMLDVAIIGCGVVGAAAAYELSHYPLHVAVLEAENDVADGTTKANSAILHAGYDPEPGTQMARLNVQGVALAKEICARLDVPYRQCGSLVLALSQAELPHLQKGRVWPHIYTLFLVVVGWAMFVGNDTGVSFGLLFHKLFVPSGGVSPLYFLRNYGVLLVVSILCCTPLIEKIWNLLKKNAVTRCAAILALLVVSTAYVVGSTNSPFLYFKF